MPAKANEIALTRIFDAPVKAVWEAWTDPNQVAQWWGPRGFRITTHSRDLRSGGHWDYTMHGPDGTDYENSTKYLEVEPMKRMVYDHGANKERPPLFRVTVQFIDLKGKTRMEMTMALATPEIAAQTKTFIKKAGGDATWDRLAEYLEKQTAQKEVFVINRTFEAPIATVYDAWTDPKHFSQWLPPTGFTMQFIEADIRPGGRTFYSMTNGQGLTMYGRAEYRELRRPDRLVYTQQFCDKDGKVSRHPMASTWPETMLTTVTLAEEDAGRTRVTVQWEAIGRVTPEELDTFVKSKAGMTQGWTGSFDKLEGYLEKQTVAGRG